MYNKLPVKERIELMKSYRKANKDMSYHDMVKDYNDSYQKFDKGGEFNDYTQPGPLTTGDSHDSYGFSFPESFEKTKSILEKTKSLKDLDFNKKYKINRNDLYKSNSKLKFENNPNTGYGIGLNDNSSSVSAGVKLLNNNPQYNISVNKNIGKFTGNLNSSFATNPQSDLNLNYNNKGLNVGAGILRKDAENIYRANAGYNSNKFGTNANYVYDKNSETPHLLDINANANLGDFGINGSYNYNNKHNANLNLNYHKNNLGLSGNYGYNDEQHSGGLNLNYNKNNLGVGVGANYNENDGVGANFNISKKFEYGGIQQFDNGGKKSVNNNLLSTTVRNDNMLYNNGQSFLNRGMQIEHYPNGVNDTLYSYTKQLPGGGFENFNSSTGHLNSPAFNQLYKNGQFSTLPSNQSTEYQNNILNYFKKINK